MKNLIIFILSILIVSCKKEATDSILPIGDMDLVIESIPEDWVTLHFDNDDTILTPQGFELVRLQDSDTYQGLILGDNIEIAFRYGLINTPRLVIINNNCYPSINSEFCIEISESKIEASFADSGPAYFDSTLDNKDLFLQIMSSFTSQ